MAEDMHFLIGQFCAVKFLDEPFELVAGIDRIVEGPRVESSAVVCV